MNLIYIISLLLTIFINSINAKVQGTDTISASKTIRFLIMGDWGTQTSPSNNNKNNNKRDLSDLRLVDDFSNSQSRASNLDELDSFQNQFDLLADNSANDYNNNNNNNKNYWSVLVAKAMATYADSYPANFLIALGDNFYNNGVSSTSDSLWTTYYTNVFNYDSLQIPWYAIFGNHDYGQNKNNAGNLQAQIDYNDGRWHAGYCYSQSYTIPNSAMTIDVVFIDTTLIAPQETYMTSTSAGISSSTQASRQNGQLECLESYLSESQASYLLVAGHYPMFSTGKNGPGDMDTMVENLLPLFIKYNVDAYLCGHDHRLEHLNYKTSTGTTIDFIISGAAGKPDEQLSNGITSAATSNFASATGGFAVADVDEASMTVNFLDSEGNLLYTMSRYQTRSVEDENYIGAGSSDSNSNRYDSSQDIAQMISSTSSAMKQFIETAVVMASVIGIVLMLLTPRLRGTQTKDPSEIILSLDDDAGDDANPKDITTITRRNSGVAAVKSTTSSSALSATTSVSRFDFQSFKKNLIPAKMNGKSDLVRHGLHDNTTSKFSIMESGPPRDITAVPVAPTRSVAQNTQLNPVRKNQFANLRPPAPLNVAVRNLHESAELVSNRPSNDAISQAIKETAHRIHSLGLTRSDLTKHQSPPVAQKQTDGMHTGGQRLMEAKPMLSSPSHPQIRSVPIIPPLVHLNREMPKPAGQLTASSTLSMFEQRNSSSTNDLKTLHHQVSLQTRSIVIPNVTESSASSGARTMKF